MLESHTKLTDRISDDVISFLLQEHEKVIKQLMLLSEITGSVVDFETNSILHSINIISNAQKSHLPATITNILLTKLPRQEIMDRLAILITKGYVEMCEDINPMIFQLTELSKNAFQVEKGIVVV